MRLLCLLFLLYCSPAFAQNTKAEKLAHHEGQFAQAGLQNLPQAFMKYMDTAAAVTFRGGAWKPMKPFYANKKPDSSRLVWGPAIAISSADGSLGLTAGPWTWQAGAKSPVVDAGYFITLWRQGKFVMDCGYSLDSLLMHPQIHEWRRASRLHDLTISARTQPLTSFPDSTDQLAFANRDQVLKGDYANKNDIPNFSDGFAPNCTVFIPNEAVESRLPVTAMRMMAVEQNAKRRYKGGWQSGDGTMYALYGTLDHKGKPWGFFRVYTQDEKGNIRLSLASYFN